MLRSENKNCPIWKNRPEELRPPFKNTRKMRPEEEMRPRQFLNPPTFDPASF
jgi:hypothetical protein